MSDIRDLPPMRRWASLVTIAVLVYVVVVEVILAIGFVCLLVGAEPSNWLTETVYRSVARAFQPLRGTFGALETGTTGAGAVEPVVETSILFAMVVYGIIALAAHDLVQWLAGPRRAPERRTPERRSPDNGDGHTGPAS
jgi:hypothetical protein